MGKNGKMLFSLAKRLRCSQGFYTRLYSKLCTLTTEEWEKLEAQLPDFHDDLDVIFYLEQ